MREKDLTEDKLSEIKAKHGGEELHMLEAPNGDVILVHKPSRQVFQRFMKHLQNEQRDRLQTFRDFVSGCLAAPSTDEADKLFEQYPAFPVSCGDVLMKLGGGGELEPKKL